MTMLSRLFSRRPDPREALRPLWYRVVEIAREPGWYVKGGIADSVVGRYDAITLVLSLVLLRMEREEALAQGSVFLTELFVDDMDAELRQAGVGDLVVGKRVGRLVSVLGGRLGALREALARPDDAGLVAAIERNVTFGELVDPAAVAAELRHFAGQLEALSVTQLLAGEIPR
jgi:cytochrome b pre-mRNA-processing protein 3